VGGWVLKKRGESRTAASAVVLPSKTIWREIGKRTISRFKETAKKKGTGEGGTFYKKKKDSLLVLRGVIIECLSGTEASINGGLESSVGDIWVMCSHSQAKSGNAP